MTSTDDRQKAIAGDGEMPVHERAAKISAFLTGLWTGKHQLARIKLSEKKSAPETMWVDATDASAIAGFISEPGYNFYHTWAIIRPDLRKKAEKADVIRVTGLHIDLDAENSTELQPLSQQLDNLLDSLTDKLPKGVPAPSSIVFTGGGYQAYWLLEHDARMEINGDLEKAQAFELFNIELQRRLVGSDNCQNVERLLRLPWTYNLPDEKKLAKGRMRALARVVVSPDKGPRYRLEGFNAADPKLVRIKGKSGKAAKLPVVELPASLPHVDLKALALPDRLKVIIMQGAHPDPAEVAKKTEQRGGKPPSRSEWVFDVCCNCLRHGLDHATIAAILVNKDFGISAHVLDQGGNGRRYAAKQIASAMAVVANDAAEVGGELAFFAQKVIDSFGARVVKFAGVFYVYGRGHYEPLERDEMDAAIIKVVGGDATSKVIADVTKHVSQRTLVPVRAGSPPFWLDGRTDPPLEFLVFGNGMVDMRSPTVLLPHDNNLFTLNALPVVYDPDAGDPTEFLRFIDTVIPEDARATVKQMLADFLSPEVSTDRTWIPCFIGGAGTGKTTLMNLVVELVGQRNICFPDVSDMGTTFGLQGWIGKRLAIFNEIDTTGCQSIAKIGSLFKRISSNEPVDVHRKNLVNVALALNLRMVLFGNEMPKIRDTQRAMARRYRAIDMPFSFEDGTAKVPKDEKVGERLNAELPAIFKHLMQLRRQGLKEWRQPDSGRVWLEQTKAPIVQFVEECCDLGADFHEDKDDLFKEWEKFQMDNYGADRRLNKVWFTRLLAQAYSTIKPEFRTSVGAPRRMGGLRLKPKLKPF